MTGAHSQGIRESPVTQHGLATSVWLTMRPIPRSALPTRWFWWRVKKAEHDRTTVAAIWSNGSTPITFVCLC